MKKKKKLVRRSWTKDDLRTLKSMARDKQSVQENRQGIKADNPSGRKQELLAWCVVGYAGMNGR